MKIEILNLHTLRNDPGTCALVLMLARGRLEELEAMPPLVVALLEIIADAFGDEGPIAEYARLSCAAGLLEAALTWHQGRA